MLKKHVAPLTMCYNPPLVRGKPLGAPTFVKLVYSSVCFIGGYVVSRFGILERIEWNVKDLGFGATYIRGLTVDPYDC